jgi:hypothetical protein
MDRLSNLTAKERMMSTAESFSRKQSAQALGGPGRSQLSSGGGEQGHQDREDFQLLIEEIGKAVGEYSRQRPGVVGCVLFSVGFFIGWRLRPW